MEEPAVRVSVVLTALAVAIPKVSSRTSQLAIAVEKRGQRLSSQSEDKVVRPLVGAGRMINVTNTLLKLQ
jgi:hypothetical protein